MFGGKLEGQAALEVDGVIQALKVAPSTIPTWLAASRAWLVSCFGSIRSSTLTLQLFLHKVELLLQNLGCPLLAPSRCVQVTDSTCPFEGTDHSFMQTRLCLLLPKASPDRAVCFGSDSSDKNGKCLLVTIAAPGRVFQSGPDMLYAVPSLLQGGILTPEQWARRNDGGGVDRNMGPWFELLKPFVQPPPSDNPPNVPQTQDAKSKALQAVSNSLRSTKT